MPTLYVIAGCNGAGKTTLSKNLLPDYLGIKEFVNADEIAKGLSPFNAEGVAFAAGRIMLTRIRELASEGADFAIETTLASRSYASLFQDLKSRGYEIFLLFVYLQNVNEALKRVKQRVKNGGHNIPENVVIRRFDRGLKNLTNTYIPLADRWIILDNSLQMPNFVAERKVDEFIIHNAEIWKNINAHE
jgi:predicted ABC-type ATPase